MNKSKLTIPAGNMKVRRGLLTLALLWAKNNMGYSFINANILLIRTLLSGSLSSRRPRSRFRHRFPALRKMNED
jgi:hypothetical protein